MHMGPAGARVDCNSLQFLRQLAIDPAHHWLALIQAEGMGAHDGAAKAEDAKAAGSKQ